MNQLACKMTPAILIICCSAVSGEDSQLSARQLDEEEKVYTVHVVTAGGRGDGTDHVAEIVWVNSIGIIAGTLRIDGTERVDPASPRPRHLDRGTTYTNREFTAWPGLQFCLCYVRLTEAGGGGGSWECLRVDVYEEENGEAVWTLPYNAPRLQPGGRAQAFEKQEQQVRWVRGTRFVDSAKTPTKKNKK